MNTAALPSAPVCIGGILRWRHLARLGVLSVPDRPGVAAAILGALGCQDINVQFLVQCIDLHGCTQLILCVDVEDAQRAQEILADLRSQLNPAAITMDYGAAVIAIFGPDFRERPGIAGKMFEALAAVGINILAISTSISTVSCLIQEDELERAQAALEAAFTLP